jgi:bifunctional polynucleotide phosphatase/kinase
LLVGRYQPEGTTTETPGSRRKIAAFDLDSTLITTASGKTHGNEATDWKWWHHSVPGRVRELYKDGYRVAIISNQAGLTIHFDANYKGPQAAKTKASTRVAAFKQKVNAILSHLDIPTTVYAATAHDIYRKPRTGMWTELCDDYDINPDTVDLANSFFVGDAGGRTAVVKTGEGTTASAKDFSCSDRNFAHNVGGITFQTPEEFFLGEKPRDFTREFDLANHPRSEDAAIAFEKPKDTQEIVVMCAAPGGGKSTFFWRYLKPLGYERINQDILKSRDKCVKVADEQLSAGKSVAIGILTPPRSPLSSHTDDDCDKTTPTLTSIRVLFGSTSQRSTSSQLDVFGSRPLWLYASTTAQRELSTPQSTRRNARSCQGWHSGPSRQSSRSPQ